MTVMSQPNTPGSISNLSSNKALQVPNDIEALLSNGTESIDHLFHSDNLPPIFDPSATNLPPLTSCITGFVAHCDIDKLLQYPVPPWGWVDKLTLALDKCMGSDIPPIISLRHPTTLDLHLPQWIINHWYSTLHIIKQRDLWVNVN